METNFVETHTDELRRTVDPSQLVNIWWLLWTMAVLVIAKQYGTPYSLAIIPGFIYICKRIIIACWEFRFHEKTIAERKGVFSVHTREIHYSRIKSIRLDEPFLLRIFGLSSILLITSDPYIRVLRIYAVYNGEEMVDYIKQRISIWRQNRGVGEHDIHPLM